VASPFTGISPLPSPSFLGYASALPVPSGLLAGALAASSAAAWGSAKVPAWAYYLLFVVID